MLETRFIQCNYNIVETRCVVVEVVKATLIYSLCLDIKKMSRSL
jgi:hypothetical protein